MSASLKGKVLFITGASRGIGKAIALRAARDGAKIAVVAKTTSPNPKLPGTIYSAAEEIEEAGGEALPIKCDIRSEEDVSQAVEKTVEAFGKLDILVNNASAINLTSTEDCSVSRYDLMHQINTRGTWLVSKMAIPHLKKAENPHILNLSPPLDMHKKWFAPHVAYTMAKYGMSMCVLGMSEELKKYGIGVNALWPYSIIRTAALQVIEDKNNKFIARTPEIMADAAHMIFSSNSKSCTGNFFMDELYLRENGVTDFERYNCEPNQKTEDLSKDFFLSPEQVKKMMELRKKQQA